MYTRLYTSVLNRYHAVDYCAGFHHCYADSGLFGIAASVYPHFAGSVADVIAQQLHQLTGRMSGGIQEQEVKRAKNMLKSTLVMALESKMTAVEGASVSLDIRSQSDLGRQTQIHGKKVSVEEMCAKIDALTTAVSLKTFFHHADAQDLHRTASRVLHPSSGNRLNYGLGSGKPTIVAQGKNLSALGDVKRALQKWGLGAS